MPDDQKSFFSVLRMSEAFREFDGRCKEVMGNGMSPESTNQAKIAFIEMSINFWQLRIDLAQAQQLTMISESLKKLTEKMLA